MAPMEQLISDIEAYCAKRGISPQKLLREAISATGSLWRKWKDGEASPTMKVADRLREYMAAGGVHPTPHGNAAAPKQEGAAR